MRGRRIQYLVVEQIERQLQTNRLQVGSLQSAGDVHVHVQEAVQNTAFFGLLDLQLSQQVDEPLETPLLTVDPKKIHLFERATSSSAWPSTVDNLSKRALTFFKLRMLSGI